MKPNQVKPPLISLVDIKLESRSIFILPDQSSALLESKTFCFYFPQLGEIFYVQLSHKQQKQKNLQTFVRELMIEKDMCAKWKVNLNVSLSFKTFDGNEQITPTSKLFFKQCIRVKIILQGILQKRIFENKTSLQIKLSSEKIQTVEVDAHLKMRVGQLLILYKLDHYNFSSLMVDGKIVKQYQTLQKLSLQAKKHDAHVLFPFQTFYYDMHAIYKHMISKAINFQELIYQYANNPQQNQALQLIYKNTPTSTLDKITQFTILYITSQYFHLAQHKKYLCQYFNGKVKQLQDNKQSQITSLMINSLQKLNQVDDTRVIYIYQQMLDEFQYQQLIQGQIFRIQTLSPATNQINKLKLQPTKKYLFYEIEHLSAKYIGRYTCQRMGFTHIVLPYNNYLIKSIKNQGQNVYIQLVELPTPKHLNHNLILWITNDFNEAKAFDSKKIIEQLVKYQLMLFKNVETYQIWLKKYVSLTASRKFCIIYNKDGPQQGVKTIEITKQYLGQNADIQLYVKGKNYQQFQPFLDFKKIFLTDNIASVLSFIMKCFGEPQQLKSEQCSCSIS